MSVPGILVDHRLIADGDELALLPAEAAAFAGSVLKVRRASGAALSSTNVRNPGRSRIHAPRLHRSDIGDYKHG